MPINTVDYWMTPSTKDITRNQVLTAINKAEYSDKSTVHIYIHVPFCANECRFCFMPRNTLANSKHFLKDYSHLVIKQLDLLLKNSPVENKQITSIAIGGGSPDLLGESIGPILDYLTNLPGFDTNTELTSELALNTTKKAFIDALTSYGTTKISFGVQTFIPKIRRSLRLFSKILEHISRVVEFVDGRIPVVAGDLLTGLPGQTIGMALNDLETLKTIDGVNAISSYLLIPAASPELVADMYSGVIPDCTSELHKAYTRVNSLMSLTSDGWIRRGASSFYNPKKIDPKVLEKIQGNEAIAGGRYESFVLGIGPNAVSHFPGVRFENTGDFSKWADSVLNNVVPLDLNRTALKHLKDFAFWAFPLRHQGLSVEEYEELKTSGSISSDQIKNFEDFIAENLIELTNGAYKPTPLGEVMSGHLVSGLKKRDEREEVISYINDGLEKGKRLCEQKSTG